MGRLRIGIIISILGIFVAMNAWAVGYERIEVPEAGKQPQTTVMETASNGSFVQKCPVLLDETAAFVTDLLSQFGLINKKAP